MRFMSLAVLMAVLAAGLTVGCVAPTTTSTGTTAGSPYQVNQGALGLRVEDDPAYSLSSPFRFAAFLLYPVGVLFQAIHEVPYVLATAVTPELFGISEVEQQYLEMRWGLKPPPKP